MKRRWLVSSVVLLSLVLALPASTQTHSVLTNPGFDTDVSGWTAGAGSLAHTTTIYRTGPGAAEVTLVEGMWFYGSGIQCVNLSDYPDWLEDGGAKYLTVNGYLRSDGTTQVNLIVVSWNNSDCSGSSVGNVQSTPTTAADWLPYTVTASIPTTAVSIRIGFVGQSMSAGTFYADDLAAFSSSTTAVQTQGMAARNSLWAAGLVGVAAVGVVLGRRKKS